MTAVVQQGANYQPKDADLTTIAGLTATTDNFMQAKSSAWASRTPTQVTADLIAMVGDSGSGGTKGLVPAPASGDAAAGKFLKADGTWVAPSSGGLTIAHNSQPTADAATYEVTGLSAYNYIKIVAFLGMSASATASLACRVSGGTWRTLATTGSSGAAGRFGFVADIANFGNSSADGKVYGGIYHVAGTVIDASDAITSGGTTTLFTGYASYNEAWDEVRLSVSTGNVVGATVDQRGYVTIYGSV